MKNICSLLSAVLLVTTSTYMYSMQRTRNSHSAQEQSRRRAPHREQYHKMSWQDEYIFVIIPDEQWDSRAYEEAALAQALRNSLHGNYAQQSLQEHPRSPAPVRQAQQLAPITPADECPICLGTFKDCPTEQRYKTACCARFICKKCVEKMWNVKRTEQHELQDSGRRIQYGRRQDFAGWPNTQVDCPFCRHSPLAARPLAPSGVPQAPAEQLQ